MNITAKFKEGQRVTDGKITGTITNVEVNAVHKFDGKADILSFDVGILYKISTGDGIYRYRREESLELAPEYASIELCWARAGVYIAQTLRFWAVMEFNPSDEILTQLRAQAYSIFYTNKHKITPEIKAGVHQIIDEVLV